MGLNLNSKIVTDGLLVAYDMSNTEKSWKGIPTTNLLEGYGFSNYNNVPSSVTTTLTAINEYYKGAQVYQQTITPLDASGVSWLTAGNNPGIGVVSGGGGGTGGRYTGHSVFFKPMFQTHSSPIYTHYSNIAGWQSSTNYESVGDGWYRAHVIWYDSVTRSDGKYWAINPLAATLNIPLTVYWAGPFKEDRNDSTFVSQYVYSSRSSSQSIVDLTGRNTISASSLTYASDKTFSFNGASSYVSLGASTNYLPMPQFTLETWHKSSGLGSGMSTGALWGITYGIVANIYSDGNVTFNTYNSDTSSNYSVVSTSGANLFNNAWHHVVYVVGPSTSYIYVDGVLNASASNSGSWSGTNVWSSMAALVGNNPNNIYYYFNGQIPVARIYNRALTDYEVRQNFNALRGRYGL